MSLTTRPRKSEEMSDKCRLMQCNITTNSDNSDIMGLDN